MSEELKFSDEYLALVEETMNQALDSISEGGPLVPFVIVVHNGVQEMQRFMVGDDETWNLGESVDQARKYINELQGKADLATIAIDGRLDMDDKLVDAIIVQAFQTGMEASYFFGQAYRPAEDPEGFDLIGEGVIAAEDEPLW